MGTVQLGAATFEDTITRNEIVFVDFWAAWCGPCRQFAPVFEKAATDHPDIVFGKVDTESERVLAASGHITSIPTLMVFKDGSLVFSQQGTLATASLEQLITAVEELDAEHVRREAAAQSRSA